MARQALLRLRDAARRAGWPSAAVHLLPGERAALLRRARECKRPGGSHSGRPNGRAGVRDPGPEARLLALRLAEAEGAGPGEAEEEPEAET